MASNRISIIVALLAAATSISTVFLNYWLVERARTDLSAQTLAIEKIKVSIAEAAQETSESVAKIDAARLEQEKQLASMQAELESKKIEIENKKNSNNQIGLTPDLTKLANDLRPNIVITCDGHNVDSKTVKLECSFKNIGAQRANIRAKTVGMYDSNQKGIHGALDNFDGEPNTILPGGTESNTYTVILTPIGQLVAQPIYKIEFVATTDQQAINMARRLSGGYIAESELKELSQQNYTVNLRFFTTQPRQ